MLPFLYHPYIPSDVLFKVSFKLTCTFYNILGSEINLLIMFMIFTNYTFPILMRKLLLSIRPQYQSTFYEFLCSFKSYLSKTIQFCTYFLILTLKCSIIICNALFYCIFSWSMPMLEPCFFLAICNLFKPL